MEHILSFFDFTPAKFLDPLFIVGIILLVLSVFLIAGAEKLDTLIVNKRKSKSSKASDEETSVIADVESNEDDASNDVKIDETTSKDALSKKEKSRLQDNMVDEDGELSLFKRKDGTPNYFVIIKSVGFLTTIISAIMVVVGLGW